MKLTLKYFERQNTSKRFTIVEKTLDENQYKLIRLSKCKGGVFALCMVDGKFWFSDVRLGYAASAEKYNTEEEAIRVTKERIKKKVAEYGENIIEEIVARESGKTGLVNTELWQSIENMYTKIPVGKAISNYLKTKVFK